jgi:hypothetical protein
MEVSGQLHALATLLQKTVPGTHWIGSWVGPRAVLDAVICFYRCQYLMALEKDDLLGIVTSKKIISVN